MMFNNILTTILGAAHLAAMDAPPGGDVADAGPVDPPPDMPAHPAGWVRLTVVDDGPGMNDAILDHLFDRFFTTKQRVGPWGWRGGAGLIEELGGRIAVESASGAGPVFTVHPPGADARDVAAPPDAQNMPRGHERVILIDDEAEMAGVFRRVLVRPGRQVEASTSPSVALERFRHDPSRFDLVISDMVMPQMSGAELVAAMRATRPDLPVMFCSGCSPGDIVPDGPDAELPAKPVDPARLAVRVRARRRVSRWR